MMRSMLTFSARRWTQEGLVPSVFAGSLLAASCGGTVSAYDVQENVQALEICVDANTGALIPEGTCGEDSQCRDAAGFVIEGTVCIEEPTMCTMDTEAPVITVHGGEVEDRRRRRGGVKITLEDCNVEIVDACEGPLDLTTASAQIVCVGRIHDDRQHHTWGFDSHHCDRSAKIIDSQTVLLKSHGEYVISFTVQDSAGNVASASCAVNVPKNRCDDDEPITTGPTDETCN